MQLIARRGCYCVQNDDDNYNVFANDKEHSEQPEFVNDTYLEEQERDLLASLIEKLKCEINDNKNRNKFLETSNKALVDKLKDLKKFQAELDRYHDVNYASKVEIDCAKAKVVKSERLETELSKSNTTSKSFEALQQHAIDLELALQQYLKAQLQDKSIAISKLKKLTEKMKGKSVEPKFEKPSVIRQPNAFKSQRQSILGVISTTSVSRPHLNSNRLEDRVMHNNSEGKKQQVEDHRMNFEFSNNKTRVTACNDSLNARPRMTKMPMVVPISTREPKRNVNQSVATPLKKTVALESTNQKPRSKIRKQHEQISKTCKWW
ncbi:hypothetical protein Tco_0287212 [Tanacetum coccineum]